MSNTQSSVLCLFPQHSIPELEEFRRKYIFHPGGSIPFHVTLLHRFLIPDQINADVVRKLQKIARAIPRFQFQAKPLSCFPTTRVLYLTPSPLTPIEELSTQLYRAFPSCHNHQDGFPVFHMTIALGYPQGETDNIVADYFSSFGKEPLSLTAHHLGVCVQRGAEWNRLLTINLGPEQNELEVNNDTNHCT